MVGRKEEQVATASARAWVGAKTTPTREAMFRDLLKHERDRAIAVAYHLTGGDRELAEDVAQEAFLRAYRALPSFRGEAALSTWFLRIVIRQAGRVRRREALRARWTGWRQPSRPDQDDPEVADPSPGPERRASSSAARSRIRGVLASLPAAQRAAFALVHLEGMTIEEAARALGKAPGTLKSHLHRALVTLRRELADWKEDGHGGAR